MADNSRTTPSSTRNSPFPAKQAAQIAQTLARQGPASLKRSDVDKRLLTPENRELWGLPGIQLADFIRRAEQSKLIQSVRISLARGGATRYLIGDPGPFTVALSLSPHSYLSHYSAMQVHGLTDQTPRTVYVNVEQRLQAGGGTLTQGAIDRTFSRPCRMTRNTGQYGTYRIVRLNGANTGRLDVVEQPLEDGSVVQVTGLARTLIDAVVRPVHAGGVFEVAGAYRAAKGRVSVDELLRTLRGLHFSYPYHQAIGYYLERAGYTADQVEPFRQLPLRFDFYLDYALRQRDYNERWRLFVPQGF